MVKQVCKCFIWGTNLGTIHGEVLPNRFFPSQRIKVEAFFQWWRAFKQHNTKPIKTNQKSKPADFRRILQFTCEQTSLIPYFWERFNPTQFKIRELTLNHLRIWNDLYRSVVHPWQVVMSTWIFEVWVKNIDCWTHLIVLKNHIDFFAMIRSDFWRMFSHLLLSFSNDVLFAIQSGIPQTESFNMRELSDNSQTHWLGSTKSLPMNNFP